MLNGRTGGRHSATPVAVSGRNSMTIDKVLMSGALSISKS
jgi:hypothetical protein